MDGGFWGDIGEILRQVETAEVVTIYLPLLGKTLIVDTRYSLEDDPLVRVVPVARGPEERLRWIQRRRPQFPKPSSLALIPWTHSSANLVRMGVADKLQERLAVSRRPAPVQSLARSIQELIRLERAELIRAITGEQYHTFWARKG
jgi:hypothetical protein